MSCLQRQRNLAKREVRKQVDRTIASQFSLYSEIFGKRIRQQMFDEDRAKLRKIIENQIDNAFDTFGSSWNTFSPNEQREKLALFLDKTFRRFARVPKGKHALTWYRRQTQEALALRGNSDFAASYNKYSKASGCWCEGFSRRRESQSPRISFRALPNQKRAFRWPNSWLSKSCPDIPRLTGFRQSLSKHGTFTDWPNCI